MHIFYAGEGPVIELPDDPQTAGGFSSFLTNAGGNAAQQDAQSGWAIIDCRRVVAVQVGTLTPELADRRVTLWTADRHEPIDFPLSSGNFEGGSPNQQARPDVLFRNLLTGNNNPPRAFTYSRGAYHLVIDLSKAVAVRYHRP